MKVLFKTSFLRDIKKVREHKTKELIRKVILSVESADALKYTLFRKTVNFPILL